MSFARTPKDAQAAGFRDGLREVLSFGRYDAAPPVVRKGLGSIATDRRERHGDMGKFRGDVAKHRPGGSQQ